MARIEKPLKTEYPEFYNRYLKQLPDQEIFSLLEEQSNEISKLLEELEEQQGNFAYAPEKWSIKTLFSHMIDTERIMAYRALAISRGEQSNLPGFDENLYAENANADQRTLNSLLEEYRTLRKSNLVLFKNFSEKMLENIGNANGTVVSVRALIFIIAAHERHHLNILKSRYLPELNNSLA